MKSCIGNLRKGDTIHTMDGGYGERIFCLAGDVVHESDCFFTAMAKTAMQRTTTPINYLFFHEEITRIEKGKGEK